MLKDRPLIKSCETCRNKDKGAFRHPCVKCKFRPGKPEGYPSDNYVFDESRK